MPQVPRKIIQITVTSGKRKSKVKWGQEDYMSIHALCDDGTVWARHPWSERCENWTWALIESIPQRNLSESRPSEEPPQEIVLTFGKKS